MEDTIKRWLATYTDGDLDTAMSHYTEDVEFEDPIFGERVVGREALRKAFSTFFFTGVTRLAFLRWTGGDGGGAVEWEWTANWGPDRSFLGFDVSNKRFIVRGASILALRNGLIARQVDLWDARGALRQIGAI